MSELVWEEWDCSGGEGGLGSGAQASWVEEGVCPDTGVGIRVSVGMR